MRLLPILLLLVLFAGWKPPKKAGIRFSVVVEKPVRLWGNNGDGESDDIDSVKYYLALRDSTRCRMHIDIENVSGKDGWVKTRDFYLTILRDSLGRVGPWSVAAEPFHDCKTDQNYHFLRNGERRSIWVETLDHTFYALKPGHEYTAQVEISFQKWMGQGIREATSRHLE